MRRLLPVLAAALALVPTSAAGSGAGRPVALVTAETANELLALSLGPRGGHVLRRLHLPHPQTVAATCAAALVVDPPAGTVTLFAPRTLRPLTVLRSFRSPQLAVFAGSQLAYVTDAGSGDLAVVDVARRTVVARVFVGLGAHHLALSPARDRLWVALGEDATTIVRLDVANPRRPRVVGRLHPAVAAHDLAFAPGGRTVWVTSASQPVVSVYAAADGRLLRRIPAGRAPQHVVFDRGRALVTSGYGSSLQSVSLRTLRRLRLVRTPYGSFNLAADGPYVVTTSLLTGQVSEFRLGDLRRLWTRTVARAARAVAIAACSTRS